MCVSVWYVRVVKVATPASSITSSWLKWHYKPITVVLSCRLVQMTIDCQRAFNNLYSVARNAAM